MDAKDLLERYAAGERGFAAADLTGVNLSWSNLAGANLSRAELQEANLEGADLRKANMSGARWAGAKGLNLFGALNTEWPTDEA